MTTGTTLTAMTMTKISLVIALLCAGNPISANVSLPKIFGDNMVLQRNVPVPVWGWADANEKIEVRFNHQVKTVKAGKDGKWLLYLDPENAGGPYTLIIKGKNLVQVNNVLVGEVWICSGQSNMEWTVGQSMNAKEEIEDADIPFIRHIKISKTISSLPNDDFASGTWEVCDSSTVADFTGLGYFFARRIYDELKIPVGLINASWGGTNIETWISREAFESSDEFKEMIAAMPRINLDSLSKLNVQASELRIEKLQSVKLKDLNADLFKEPSFDD
jgi:sialate O-acetylesterase